MNIKVLIPSEEYKSFAGARIRYGRLAPELAGHGITLTLEDIAAFEAESSEADVILISKCHDARALVAAAAAFAQGRLVGVDLFDDYFSQTGDSRLNRYRLWLRQLLHTCHFALCSTPAMAQVVKAYQPGLAVHVVNDPAPDLDRSNLRDVLDAKLAQARNEQSLRLAWFGVGDNPHFRVGLSDLAAFSDTLRELGRGEFNVELTILTNPRALTAEGLALIGQLPLRHRLLEWSEEQEASLLAEAFACFLPVSAQPFSAAKSLNRAVTALSAGCQVISAGYPLYEALGDLIYRDVSTFLDDLRQGEMKHSALGLERFDAAIDANASAVREAACVAEFLGQLKPPNQDPRPIALIHGQATSGAAHKAVRALHGLSIGSPYCGAQLGFDVLFRPVRNGLAMLISDQAAKRVPAQIRASLQPARYASERKFWIVPDDGATDAASLGPSWNDKPLAFQLATYRSTMAHIAGRVEDVFGPCRVIVSESSAIPFSSAV